MSNPLKKGDLVQTETSETNKEAYEVVAVRGAFIQHTGSGDNWKHYSTCNKVDAIGGEIGVSDIVQARALGHLVEVLELRGKAALVRAGSGQPCHWHMLGALEPLD